MACTDCSHYGDCYWTIGYTPSSCVMYGYRYFSPSIDYLNKLEQEKQNKKKYVYVDGVKCELITM